MISLPGDEADGGTIRKAEKQSIQAFLERQGEYLRGRVLDYGCGLQPYRNLVESFGGEYTPFDRVSFPANVSKEDVGGMLNVDAQFDAVLVNQVMQYVPHPDVFLVEMAGLLVKGGVLVLTFTTCWDEVEREDLFRFTLAGMTGLLSRNGFDVLVSEKRAEVAFTGFKFPLGYGIVGRA